MVPIHSNINIKIIINSSSCPFTLSSTKWENPRKNFTYIFLRNIALAQRNWTIGLHLHITLRVSLRRHIGVNTARQNTVAFMLLNSMAIKPKDVQKKYVRWLTQASSSKPEAAHTLWWTLSQAESWSLMITTHKSYNLRSTNSLHLSCSWLYGRPTHTF